MEHDLNDIISLSIFILNLGNLTRTFHIEDDHIFHGGSKSVCPVIELEDKKIMDSNIYKQAEIEFRSAQAFKSILEYIKMENKEDVDNYVIF